VSLLRPKLFRRVVIFVVLLGFWAGAHAQPFIPGQTYFGRNNYIEYRAGNIPVILTAGHGGDLTPAEIPNRTYGTTVTDSNTVELAIAMADAIFARSGKRPHLIINHLRRTKLDPNREIVEAAQGNTFAEQAWNEYHTFITAARAAAETSAGFGFLVDVHGHGHTVQRLELGYGYDNDDLNLSDTALTNPGFVWLGTLRTLALRRPGVDLPTLLRGERSLGEMFNLRGFEAWPSFTFPTPGTEPFFNGGFTVQTHTCLGDNGPINGVQIESNMTGVRDSSTNRANYGLAFARIIQAYLWNNYGYDVGTWNIGRIVAPANSVLTRGGSPLTLTVTRTGPLASTSNITLSFGGTATRGAGGDYTASATFLNFSANATNATVTLTPTALATSFGDRSLTITLAPIATQAADISPLVLTLNDGLSQTVRISAPTPARPESSGAARFRLTRTGSATTSLGVPLTWSGSALQASDYFDAPASATFAVGVSSLDVDVPIVDDGRAEPDRTLVATPGGGAGYVVGLPSSATVTVLDDDRPANLAVWLRGELAGNVVADSSGNSRAATTLPATGALATGPTSITVPAAGNAPAINFDGVNDTLFVPRFTLDPAGAFTLAFYFRLNAGGAIFAQNLASYGTRDAAGSLHVYLATINASNGTFALRTNLPGLSASALDISRTSPISWQDGVWRHYALAVGADGSARVYLDGVLQRTATGRTGSLSTTELLCFGWRPFAGTSTAFMRGALRDIRVYQRTLAASEANSLSSARLSFSAWLSSQGLAALAASVDSDGDGLSLMMEYGLGASGVIATGTLPRYGIALQNGFLTLTFQRESNASDLQWTIEASNTLTDTWVPLARRNAADATWTILVSGVAITDTNGLVVVTDAAPLGITSRRFLRLRVSSWP